MYQIIIEELEIKLNLFNTLQTDVRFKNIYTLRINKKKLSKF